METQGSPALPVKKKSPTPKDIIYQRFRGNARYEVEEVPESTTNGCPGLAIPQKVTCLFRCSLQLPEVFVVSEICKRKKDAEQSAAQKAIEKVFHLIFLLHEQSLDFYQIGYYEKMNMGVLMFLFREILQCYQCCELGFHFSVRIYFWPSQISQRLLIKKLTNYSKNIIFDELTSYIDIRVKPI